MATNKETNRSMNVAGLIGGAVGMAFSKVLGMTIVIPIVFSAIGYFIAARLDKRLQAVNQTFGGFGTTDSSSDTFRFTVAVDFGHFCWGLLGVGLMLSGVNTQIQLDVLDYLALGVYFGLFITFCIKPCWWSILLLLLYNAVSIIGISQVMDQLDGFPQKTREALERGYITHIIFHGLGALLVGWYCVLRIRLVDPNVAVWKNWVSSGKISSNRALIDNPEFAGNLDAPQHALKGALPPPLLSETARELTDLNLATAWPRFFARFFDLWWEGLLLSIMVLAFLGWYWPGATAWIKEPGSGWLFAFLCAPVVLILDGVLYAIFGNTPGKLLLGLRVATVDGRHLSLVQYLNRNASMWVSGLAFGVPVVNLFTLVNQRDRLGRGEQTSYDKATGFRVYAKPTGVFRKATFGIAFIGLLAVILLPTGVEHAAQPAMTLISEPQAVGQQITPNPWQQQFAERQVAPNAGNQFHSWKNPWTSVSAIINGNWEHSGHLSLNEGRWHPSESQFSRFRDCGPDAQGIFTFSLSPDVTTISVSQAPGDDLFDYLRAFQKNNAAKWLFSDSGSFYERDGHQAWQGSARFVDKASYQLDVQIVQFGPAFWQVETVTSSSCPDPLLAPLYSAIWSTVR
jgi:uncharacterized RDD family membrane protein YckC